MLNNIYHNNIIPKWNIIYYIITHIINPFKVLCVAYGLNYNYLGDYQNV